MRSCAFLGPSVAQAHAVAASAPADGAECRLRVSSRRGNAFLRPSFRASLYFGSWNKQTSMPGMVFNRGDLWPALRLSRGC
jgi:hypothetical protein